MFNFDVCQILHTFLGRRERKENINLIVHYWCEAWTLALKEEEKL